MSPPDEPATATTEDSWIDLFSHPRREPVVEAAFVLTAMAVPHQVLDESHAWHLWVPASEAARAQHELSSYWRENQWVAQRPPQSPAIDSGVLGVLGFLLVIWALPWLQSWNFGPMSPGQWHQHGAMAAAAVMDGQWWRTVTALTLHADIGHIVSNSAFGALFGGLLCRQLGSGVAWLVTLGAAALANFANAILQPDSFVSIGASTATFAAMGMLATVVWRRGYYRNLDWRRSVAPIFAAFALFSFTGIGDLNTDVMAHLFGGISGGLAGILAARIPMRWLSPRVQLTAGAASVVMIAMSWQLATAAG